MFSNCLFLLLISCSVSMASPFLAAASNDMDDFNGTFILFDVRAHKGSAESLKTTFNTLKRPEYAVKIIGEERAFFVVRDDDDCNILQSDFHGLQVKAIPTRGRPDDVDLIVRNDTGLVVVVIESTLDRDVIRQALDNALDRCDKCFKIFATFGRKPQKCILIGNIPIDQISDIICSTTADKCCDSAYTRRAMEFNTFEKSNSVGCDDANSQLLGSKSPAPSPRIDPQKIQPDVKSEVKPISTRIDPKKAQSDVKSEVKPISSPRIDPKKAQPDIKSTVKPISSTRIAPKKVQPGDKSTVKSIPSPQISSKKVQPIKPSPFVSSRPLHPLHPFPVVNHEAKENAKKAAAPHNSFSSHEIQPLKIEHPGFGDITFPSLEDDTDFKLSIFHGYGFVPHSSKSDGFF